MVSAVHRLCPLGRPPARCPQVRVLFRRPPAERRMRFSPHVALQCRIPQSLPLRESIVDSVVAVTADGGWPPARLRLSALRVPRLSWLIVDTCATWPC